MKEPKYIDYFKYKDNRGWYANLMDDRIVGEPILDVKHSFSEKGTWRGFHYQEPPYEQGKFVITMSGIIYDYVLDIDPLSSNYKKLYKFILISNGVGVWIPPGFAHGFFAAENSSIVYLITKNLWNKESERSISPSCIKDLDIADNIKIISDKDLNGIKI